MSFKIYFTLPAQLQTADYLVKKVKHLAKEVYIIAKSWKKPKQKEHCAYIDLP